MDPYNVRKFIDTLRCTTVFVWFKIDRYCHHYWNQRWVHKSEVLACSLKMKDDAFFVTLWYLDLLIDIHMGLFFVWCAQLQVRSGSSTLAKHTLKHTHAFQDEVIAALPLSGMWSYRVPGPGFVKGAVMPWKGYKDVLMAKWCQTNKIANSIARVSDESGSAQIFRFVRCEFWEWKEARDEDSSPFFRDGEPLVEWYICQCAFHQVLSY